MENREQAALKAAIMQSLSEEVDKWLDQQQTITSGYEYETECMKVAQKVNKVLLENSVAPPAKGSRNHKKKAHLLWENSHPQRASAGSAHKALWH